MRDVPPTPPSTLRRARRIARQHGLRHVYTGNVHDPDGQTTTCPGCGGPVVVRDWYVIEDYRLTDDGRCTRCDTALPGVFDGPVGAWGSRRLPVRLADPRPVGSGRHDRRLARPGPAAAVGGA
jgi:pyruvate formate lyase activating enzyme